MNAEALKKPDKLSARKRLRPVKVNPEQPLQVTIPLETEAVRHNRDLATGTRYEKGLGIIVLLDVRRRDWRAHLNLPKGTRIRWENVRTVDVHELSSLHVPMRYQITIGDGVWVDRKKQRHYFGVNEHLDGLDLKRGVTTVTLRAAVLLAVIACVGLRSVGWLLRELFHIEVSKSSLARWLQEGAGQLPDAEGMAKRLHKDKPITEAHFDELFPRGWGKGCVLVVKDEHGRIVATREVTERTTAAVVSFLQELKNWGLKFTAFYVDGCAAYKQAISQVYPEAAIQYDYFHVIQNIWRHLWRGMVKHRKAIKRKADEIEEPEEKIRLKALAKRLWKRRGLLFKSDHRMNPEERRELLELMTIDDEVSVLRGFLSKVWGIFRHSKGELGARQRFGKLRRRSEVKPETAYAKVVDFLAGRFDDMIAFLRIPGVRRNSLAESGMRSLRRLEQGHDGFRGSQGRDNYLRLYQAIRYCGWSVHRSDGLKLLPPRDSRYVEDDSAA